VTPRHRKARAARKRKELKDRLIQTRVPQGLESTLKEEAEKRRLSVSHLIRNVLEDAFHLVGDVVSSAGRIAEDSVELAGQVAEEAGRIAKTVREAADEVRAPAGAAKAGAAKAETEPRPQADDVDADKSNLRARATARRRAVPEDVLGWQALVIHRPSNCFACGRDLERGDAAHLAFTTAPQPPLWLCPDCFAKESGPA
jgi:hypothetical protein